MGNIFGVDFSFSYYIFSRLLQRVMAKAAGTHDVNAKCALCLQRVEIMEDPRALPCSHVHCLKCLTADYNTNHLVQCPTCSEVFDTTPDNLPSKGEDYVYCDSCLRKGQGNQLAVVFCTACCKKFCKTHQEAHDDLHDNHQCITADDYKRQSTKLELRMCREHPQSPYTVGCETCLSVFCVQCLHPGETCNDGLQHAVTSLDKLVSSLTKDVGELKRQVTSKEKALFILSKKATKVISDYGSETGEMIRTLHRTRDEQIEAIRVKYAELETKLIALRKETEGEIARFIDNTVGSKLSDLKKRKMKIEARLSRSHQVDVVIGYNSTSVELHRLIDIEIPSLELSRLKVLEREGERRGIELALVNANDAFIDWENGLKDRLPKSLNLLSTVEKLSSNCRSLCHYRGSTYVGLYKSIVDVIDKDYKLTTAFISPGGTVYGISIHKNKIYALVFETAYVVVVYDLSGQLITSWKHEGERQDRQNKLAIVADQLVIADKQSQKLIVYSLDGEILKRIPCAQLPVKNRVALCAAGSNSVIVTNKPSSEVFRVNITTEEVLWTSTVVKPHGVEWSDRGIVFVARADSNQIQMLDYRTGELTSELTADVPDIEKFQIEDLHIFGQTLVMPMGDDGKVHFYQLEY